MGANFSITRHWINRVSERMPNVCPAHLAECLSISIAEHNGLTTYQGRDPDRTHIRRFNFKGEYGQLFQCVVSDLEPKKHTFITIYKVEAE